MARKEALGRQRHLTEWDGGGIGVLVHAPKAHSVWIQRARSRGPACVRGGEGGGGRSAGAGRHGWGSQSEREHRRRCRCRCRCRHHHQQQQQHQ
eukprot:gene18058-biopygen2383